MVINKELELNILPKCITHVGIYYKCYIVMYNKNIIYTLINGTNTFLQPLST